MKISTEQMAQDAAIMSLATSKTVDALHDQGRGDEARKLADAIENQSVRALATLYHFITTI